MSYPQQTFSTLAQLLQYLNTEIVTNGNEEITAVKHNNVENGLATFIKKAVLNYDLAKIESSGGIITLSRNVSIITGATPTSIQWPDNFQNEYYIVNTLGASVPLASGYTYLSPDGSVNTEIPGATAIQIAKISNGTWILVGSSGTGGGGGGITGATNGLHLTGSNVKLGGTLIEDTTIDTDSFILEIIGDIKADAYGGNGGAVSPVVGDIPASYFTVWKNSATGEIALWYNNGGLMVRVGVLTHTDLVDAATIVWNLSNGTMADVAISANRNISILNPGAAKEVDLIVTHTVAGTIINLPGNVEIDGSWSTETSGRTLAHGVYNGTAWFWTLSVFAP